MDSNDFKSVQDKIQSALVATTRRTNQIAAEDLGFHRSSNPTAGEQLDETSERLLALSTSLLGAASKGTDLKAPDLEDADDVDVHWSRIVDVIDTLLEKADTCLDEYTGLVKRKGGPTEENVSRCCPWTKHQYIPWLTPIHRRRRLRSQRHSPLSTRPCAAPTF